MIFLSKEINISASYVTKKYVRKVKKDDRNKAESKDKREISWALRGISFKIAAGEAIGLVGENGSGRSTLCKIIASVSPPTTGEIEVNGKVSVIKANIGLNRKLTGRENIKLKSLQLGTPNHKIQTITDEIISFSGLEDAIDKPAKVYSNRTKSKLSLAIALHQEQDIILIDEALPTSDRNFNQRCVEKLAELKTQGKIIILVSNSLRTVKKLCDKAMWIHNGEIKRMGKVLDVIESYNAFVDEHKSFSKQELRDYKTHLREEKASFDIDEYYEQTVANLTNSHQPFDSNRIRNIFYPIKKSTKMGLLSKAVIFLMIIGWLWIAVHYVPTRPITEIISNFLSQ